jgi:hypothetical protein
MKTSLTFAIAVALTVGAMAQTPVVVAAVDRLECRLANAETENLLSGGFRCRKTVHETAPPFCTGGYSYSVRQGADECLEPFRFPAPGQAVAVSTEPVKCPPAAGGPPWQVGHDVTGNQDQCQRTRVEYVAPFTLSFPQPQFTPPKVVRR